MPCYCTAGGWVDLSLLGGWLDESLVFIKDWLDWGAGPRASSFLVLGAKALAAVDGRTTPDIADVKKIIKPVLRHRIIANFNAEADGISRDNILEKLLESSN